ncbi:hypothetical protein G7Y79_00002g006910 [Physcia stellaris]|nr:hypothetical protein G7Y79_00002g006910 [Physcia stellaris]
MTSFVALNLEPEECSDDEIDDTKEIQARDLRPMGPEYFEDAAAAYKTLFNSEIFTYPESVASFQQADTYAEVEDEEDFLDNSIQANDGEPSNNANETPNALPQILYLAYKNYGQFLLDQLKSKISRSQTLSSNGDNAATLDNREVRSTVLASLRLLIEATDRDDTDLQLWRLISRLCVFLGSKRLARYCLEAALETDDGNYDLWPEPQGLDESLAAEQLQLLLETLDDKIAESEIKSWPGRKTGLVKSLKKLVDPYPYLPTSHETPGGQSLSALLETQAEKHDIIVPLRTWESVGKSILLQITKVAQGLDNDFGTAYRLVLPSVVGSGPKSASFLREGGSTSSALPTHLIEDNSVVFGTSKEEDVDHGEVSPRVKQATKDSPSIEQEKILHVATGLQAEYDEHSLDKVGSDLASPVEEQRKELLDSKHTDAEPLQSQILESQRTMSLPTRKRSLEVAGLPESPDTGRSKSKRIKARVSTADGISEDVANHYEQQLREFVTADSSLFESACTLLSKLDADRLGTLDTLRASIAHVDQSPVDPGDIAAQDVKNLLASWNLEKSNIFLRKSKGDDEFSGANGTRNFTVFLENSKRVSQKPVISTTSAPDDGLDEFADEINQGWTSLDQLALAWIERLLSPTVRSGGTDWQPISRYEMNKWPESLKKIVVQILVQRDGYIYNSFKDRLNVRDEQLLHIMPQRNPVGFDDREESFVKQVQNMFEIHLDIYERITNPSSEVDQETRATQLDRLGRWNSLASNAMSLRSPSVGHHDLDQLEIRFLWSSVVYVSLTDPSARDHVVLCFQDLKIVLRNAGSPIIQLQNNAAMPEVSIEAAEREISSLTTMDFFLSIFNSDNSEPITIIESLEPMLEKLTKITPNEGHNPQLADHNIKNGAQTSLEIDFIALDHQSVADPKVDSMVEYIRKASLPLRLYLWQKLGSAYEAIHYPPRVLSIDFQRMELILNYLHSQEYLTTTRETRQLDLLGWLRELDVLVTSILSCAMNETNAFDFMDDSRLRSSLSILSALQRIIHVYLLWKDSVRVGQTPTFQPPRGSALTGHTASMAKFENLQVKTWMLQYMLVKEAIVQDPQIFELPGQYLLEHLNLLHDSLGLRDLCGLQSKRLLKLIRSEMLKHKATSGVYTGILKDGTSNWDRDFAQIIFDLHGIKVLPSWWGLRFHGCTPEILDRDAALELMDFVIVYANRMNIKDLAKNELKGAIEKIQAAIKLPTATTDTTFNKRSITAYLKTAINPLDLYRSFRGVVDLPSIEINSETAMIAAKGWYYLLGHLSLAKFRAQNRTIPGPLDDLDNATIYFRQDLELGIEKWEAWYRLAQVYDVKIEEYTKWNANKLNTAMEELKTLQRNAIHCYTMAIATASRANASLEDVGKMPDLYYDFATRVYASSREPYSMKAFGLEDFERHFNNSQTGMYKGRPFKGLQLYAAWKFAKVLLERAVARKPQAWASWYLLGKCLWKMHDCGDQIRGDAKRIDHTGALDAFKRAVEVVPERRDKDPILEPHYKLLSTVHKLVRRNRLDIPTAYDYLRITPYARKVPFANEPGRWRQYEIEVLRMLRSADKQNWHHRMAVRAAHIAYDTSSDNTECAKAAKEELTQQIFTKTMNIQVWRPEHERAGRHFVYTTRYVNFFVRLLIQIGDTTSLEALAKKIRKKAGDFIGHADLWDSICGQYLSLLRSRGDIQQGHFDRMFKAVPLEVFMLNADRLDTYAHQPDFDSPLIELLRETIELRKLNSNLMKASSIDDLIGDAYATLYETIMPEIIARSNEEENRVRMRVDHVLTGPADTPPPEQVGRAGDVPPTKTRTKGVTRREVQKRAEALVARSPAATLAAYAAKAREAEHAPEAEAEEGPSTGLSPRADDAKEGGLSEVEEFVDAPEEAVGGTPDARDGVVPGEEEGDGDEEMVGLEFEDVEGEGEGGQDGEGDGDEEGGEGEQKDDNEDEEGEGGYVVTRLREGDGDVMLIE